MKKFIFVFITPPLQITRFIPLVFLFISSFLISCTGDNSPESDYRRQNEKDIVSYCEVILDMSEREKQDFLSSREGELFKEKYEEEGYRYDERDVQAFCEGKTGKTNSYRSSSSPRSSSRRSSGSSSGSRSSSASGSSSCDSSKDPYCHHIQPIRRCGSINKNDPNPLVGLPETVETCSLDGYIYTLIITSCITKGSCSTEPEFHITSSPLPFLLTMAFYIDGEGYLSIENNNRGEVSTGRFSIRGRITNCGQSSNFSFDLVLYPVGQNGCRGPNFN